jgi:succinyl-diaminopimelate desuccinylase
VPDLCVIDLDVRYLPGQDHEAIRADVEAMPDVHVVKVFHRQPAIVPRDNPYVQALGTAIGRVAEPTSERLGVGRDGASDAISFIEAGVPAVECGPSGDGHHGPEEWVSIRSLGQYRAALVEFVDLLAARRLKIA